MMREADGKAERRRFAVSVAVAVFLFGGAYAAARHRPLTFLIGDGPYYAATGVSILHDHDLDLRNQLRGGLAVHGAQIALGEDGAWYPKHPILMPIAALPFLAAMGMDGLLVFNVTVLALLGGAMALLARRHAPPPAATAAVALLLLGTFLRGYVYNLSPDLFATLLILSGALAMLSGWTLRAGLLLGAAIAAKFLLIVLLPWVLFLAWARHGARGAGRCLAGTLPAAVLVLVFNTALFGSPWVTSYDRGVAVQAGVERIVTHRSQFDGAFLAGLSGELFDPAHGLLPTAPIVLLAVPGLVLLWRRCREEAIVTLGVALTLLLVLAPYRGWSASHYGNRFLMPALVLLAPAVALACGRLGAMIVRTPAAIERPAAS